MSWIVAVAVVVANGSVLFVTVVVVAVAYCFRRVRDSETFTKFIQCSKRLFSETQDTTIDKTYEMNSTLRSTTN